MYGNELALAISLLVASPGTPLPDAEYDWLQLQSALHSTAISWEILDHREKRHFFCSEPELLEDLDRLRRRYEALQGAPKIADLMRFPDRHIIQAKIDENRTLHASIQQRSILEMDRASLFRAATYELDEMHAAWNTLLHAKSDLYYVDVRRKHLNRLLELLGTRAYSDAEMPPAVPEWRMGK